MHIVKLYCQTWCLLHFGGFGDSVQAKNKFGRSSCL